MVTLPRCFIAERGQKKEGDSCFQEKNPHRLVSSQQIPSPSSNKDRHNPTPYNKENNLCKDTDTRDKVIHFEPALEGNGYPPQTQIAHKVLHKHRQSPSKEKEKPKILYLPSINGPSEKMERVIRPLNTRAVFKTQTIIKGAVLTTQGSL